MNRTFASSLIAGLLLAIGTAAAQQSSPPAPTPGPEHARLKKMEGTWDAVVTEQDGKKTKGEMKYRMVGGGLWLACEFKGEHMGKPFEGHGLDSYDTATKKFNGVWVDSWMTTPLVHEGTYDEKSKTVTSIGQCAGPDGKPMKMKMVTKKTDDDHETFEMIMIMPDGKEMKASTIEYTRRKK